MRNLIMIHEPRRLGIADFRGWVPMTGHLQRTIQRRPFRAIQSGADIILRFNTEGDASRK
jgi:hypothetical protein